jgi:hypothetical protein
MITPGPTSILRYTHEGLCGGGLASDNNWSLGGRLGARAAGQTGPVIGAKFCVISAIIYSFDNIPCHADIETPLSFFTLKTVCMNFFFTSSINTESA